MLLESFLFTFGAIGIVAFLVILCLIVASVWTTEAGRVVIIFGCLFLGLWALVFAVMSALR